MQLGSFLKYQKGKAPSLAKDEGREVIYLSPDYLRNKAEPTLVPDYNAKVEIEDGDLILLWDGSNAGEFFKGKKGALSSTMVKFLFDEIKYNKEFLFYQLKSFEEFLKAQTNGSGIPHVDKEILLSISINELDKPEQTKIAKILSTADKAIEQTEKLIAKYQHIKTGLMQDLLTKGLDANGNIRSEQTHKFKTEKGLRVPEEWRVISVEQFASNAKYSIVDGPFGSNLKTIHYRTSGIPIIQSGFVTNNYFEADEDEYLFVEKELFEREIRSKAVPGDLIMAKIGANCGTCALLPQDHPVSIIAGNSLKISVDKRNYNRYLEILFHHLYSIGKFEDLKSTTAQPAMNMQQLKQFFIPRPEREEQVLIADRIDSVAKMINDEKKKLSKLQSLKTGLMQDLLSGKVRVTVKEEATA